jgi:hypothetical protein
VPNGFRYEALVGSVLLAPLKYTNFQDENAIFGPRLAARKIQAFQELVSSTRQSCAVFKPQLIFQMKRYPQNALNK